MTDHKFTDEEIINALECCLQCDWSNTKCSECHFYTGCVGCVNELRTAALDHINRQRAEIAELKEWVEAYKNTIESIEKIDEDLRAELAKAKTERHKAIKEFAERLKERKIQPEFPWDDFYVTEGVIDEIVEEMTEARSEQGDNARQV